MKMKKTICILLTLILTFSLAACGGSSGGGNAGNQGGSTGTEGSAGSSGSAGAAGSTGSAGAGSASPAAPAKPVEITVVLSTLPNGLDPISEDFPDTVAVCNLIYDRLVNFDENNSMIPGMARSWERVDELTYKFDVNLDYVFQNGDPLTMDDIVYSFLRIRDIPKQADTGALIESVTYEGNVLTLKLKERDNTLLTRVLMTCYIVDKAYIEANGDDAVYLHPIGTGPFVIADFIPGTATSVETWDGYPFEKPPISKITFLGIGETVSRYIAVETGQAQYTGLLTPFEMDLAEKDPNLVPYTRDTTTITGFVFNCQKPPFDNVNVRTAVAYAVDRDSICALKGGRSPARSFIFGGYSDRYVESAFMPGYDLEKAKAMLEAEGYNASHPLKIEVVTYQTSEPAGELFQSSMRSIGVEVNLTIVEFSVYLATEQNGNFDMLMTSLLNRGGSPLTDLDRVDNTMYGTRNVSYYSNDRAMEIVRAMRISDDPKELTALAVELNDIIAKEVPMVPLFHFTSYYAMNKKLGNISFNNGGSIDFRTLTYNE